MIKIDTKSALGAVEINALRPAAMVAARTLANGDGAGNDFLGWMHLPSSVDETQLAAIKQCADRLRWDCEFVVAVGIGGSYLGA